MNGLAAIVFVISSFAGVYFLARLIFAAIRKQPKAEYGKKFIIAMVVGMVASTVASLTHQETETSKQVAEQNSKTNAEQKTSEPKELTPEEKAAKEAEQKAAEEKRIAEEKAAEEKRIAEEKIAEEKRVAEEQKKQEKIIKEVTTGWNVETTDTDNDNDNWEKATDLVKKYPSYIHNAEENWINIADAQKKPWEFYGKVVNLSGQIYSIEQLPPGNSVAKFFGGNCYHAMLKIGDVAVSMYIVGDSGQIQENSHVNVKGYIYGHVQLVNGLGGTERGLAFIGFQE